MVAQEGKVGIRSMAVVGSRMWVGLADGQIKVFGTKTAATPEFLANWQAHEGAVISIVQAASRVYSLAADGSMKGWNASLPSAPDDVARCGSLACHRAALSLGLMHKAWYQFRCWQSGRRHMPRTSTARHCSACFSDDLLMVMRFPVVRRRFAFQDEIPDLMQRENCLAVALTWNVNEQKPENSRVFRVLRDKADSAQVVAVCLQEIEMGGGSVAIAAAKDAILKSLQVVTRSFLSPHISQDGCQGQLSCGLACRDKVKPGCKRVLHAWACIVCQLVVSQDACLELTKLWWHPTSGEGQRKCAVVERAGAGGPWGRLPVVPRRSAPALRHARPRFRPRPAQRGAAHSPAASGACSPVCTLLMALLAGVGVPSLPALGCFGGAHC